MSHLPRGSVIAAARLTECRATLAWTPPEDSDEYAFGDYGARDGARWAALLALLATVVRYNFYS